MATDLNLAQPDQMAQSHFGRARAEVLLQESLSVNHAFGRAVYCSDSKSSVEEDGEVDLSNHLGFREITTPLLALYGLFYYLLFIICRRYEAGTHTETAAVRYISLLISKIIPKTAAPADKQARADNQGAR